MTPRAVMTTFAGRPAAATVVCSVIIASCAGQLIAQPLITSAQIRPVGLQVQYLGQLPVRHGEVITRIHAEGTNTYMTTEGGVLFALDPDTGMMRWTQREAARSIMVLGPVEQYTPRTGTASSDTGHAYLTTTQYVYALDQKDGKILEKIELRQPAGAEAIGDGTYVYFGAATQRFICIDTRTHVRIWEMTTRGVISAPPVLQGQMLYFASRDGTIYATATTQQSYPKILTGMYTIPEQVLAPLAAGNEQVYVTGDQGGIFCFDKTLSTLKWRTLLPSSSQQPPYLASEHMYVVTSGYGVYCLSTTTGLVQWRCADCRQFLLAEDGLAYLMTDSGRIAVIDSANGKRIASAVLPSDVLVTADRARKLIIVIEKRGGRLVGLTTDALPLTPTKTTAQAANNGNRQPASSDTTTGGPSADKTANPFATKRTDKPLYVPR